MPYGKQRECYIADSYVFIEWKNVTVQTREVSQVLMGGLSQNYTDNTDDQISNSE